MGLDWFSTNHAHVHYQASRLASAQAFSDANGIPEACSDAQKVTIGQKRNLSTIPVNPCYPVNHSCQPVRNTGHGSGIHHLTEHCPSASRKYSNFLAGTAVHRMPTIIDVGNAHRSAAGAVTEANDAVSKAADNLVVDATSKVATGAEVAAGKLISGVEQAAGKAASGAAAAAASEAENLIPEAGRSAGELGSWAAKAPAAAAGAISGGQELGNAVAETGTGTAESGGHLSEAAQMAGKAGAAAAADAASKLISEAEHAASKVSAGAEAAAADAAAKLTSGVQQAAGKAVAGAQAVLSGKADEIIAGADDVVDRAEGVTSDAVGKVRTGAVQAAGKMVAGVEKVTENAARNVVAGAAGLGEAALYQSLKTGKDATENVGELAHDAVNAGEMTGKRILKTANGTLEWYTQAFSATGKGAAYLIQELLQELGPDGFLGKLMPFTKDMVEHAWDTLKIPIIGGATGLLKAVVFGKLLQFAIKKFNLANMQQMLYRQRLRKLPYKLEMNYITPGITRTNIDSRRWNCPSRIKKWYKHPKIEFKDPQTIIHVHLQELGDNTGPGCNAYWDAVYNLHGGKKLKSTDEALFGKWPYFVRRCNAAPETGWCNLDHGQRMHFYELNVTNGEFPIGKALFTFYPHSMLQKL